MLLHFFENQAMYLLLRTLWEDIHQIEDECFCHLVEVMSS